MERLLSVGEAGQLLHISKSGIYGLVGTQRIPHVRIGARVLFSEHRLEEWIKEKVVEEKERL